MSLSYFPARLMLHQKSKSISQFTILRQNILKKIEKKKFNLLLHVSLFQSENSRHKGLIEHGETGGIVSQRLVSPTQGLHLPSQIPPQHSVQVKWNVVAEERGQFFDRCQAPRGGRRFPKIISRTVKVLRTKCWLWLLLQLHRCSQRPEPIQWKKVLTLGAVHLSQFKLMETHSNVYGSQTLKGL